jgi:hypothetical protein
LLDTWTSYTPEVFSKAFDQYVDLLVKLFELELPTRRFGGLKIASNGEVISAPVLEETMWQVYVSSFLSVYRGLYAS